MHKIYILTEEEINAIVKKITIETVEMYITYSKKYPEWITKKQAMQLLNRRSPVTIDNYVKKNLIRRRYNKSNKPEFNYYDVMKLKKNEH